MKILSMLAAITALSLQPAHAAEPQSMVRQALEDGQATGRVDGPVAEETRKRLNATGPLTLAVKRIYRFDQPGCARVQLDFTQEAALLPGTALPVPYSWSTQMNICADGHPPANLKRRD
ncbi:hypothetical protein [Massilia sp. CCM 8734]|uniref:hypothetical protein n=1 Tax=Massilia sp. CCM 8734 TaxID=2609283 RepID=UPI001422BB05|nr:hypothetical protein [Massilia sp. CCM 8734]NHZ99049.1 hypothetical protein [Massilia sp. CCM 8734]